MKSELRPYDIFIGIVLNPISRIRIKFNSGWIAKGPNPLDTIVISWIRLVINAISLSQPKYIFRKSQKSL